jgi:hypothetical protein
MKATDGQGSAVQPGPVLLLGSGETSPTARKIYDQFFAPLQPPVRIAVLETPAGFELNSERVAGRVAEFFRHRLPHYEPAVDVVQARKRGTQFSPDDPKIVAPLWTAEVVFAGPGSPSYAVRQLRGSLCWQAVIARHAQGATLIFASAAAIALSRHALPVYEIFKVGEDLHWKPGLDFFGAYGLELVLVTHWNNREGGEDLDTRRCFMGVSRFERLQAMLPESATIVGIDEHTALIVEMAQARCQVRGVGGVSVLRQGLEQRFENGDTFPISLLGPFRLPRLAALPVGAEVWRSIQAARARRLEPSKPPPQVVRLLSERAKARQRRDWRLADSLRQQIEALGWRVEDTPEGSRVQPRSEEE